MSYNINVPLKQSKLIEQQIINKTVNRSHIYNAIAAVRSLLKIPVVSRPLNQSNYTLHAQKSKLMLDQYRFTTKIKNLKKQLKYHINKEHDNVIVDIKPHKKVHIPNNVREYNQFGESIALMRRILKKSFNTYGPGDYKIKVYYLRFKQGTPREITLNISTKNMIKKHTKKIDSSIADFLTLESDTNILQDPDIESDIHKLIPKTLRIEVIKLKPLQPVHHLQQFKDNDANICVFDPIIEWVNEKINSVSRHSQKNYVTMLNSINKLIIEFPNGVHESKIQYVADKLNIHIRIFNPIGLIIETQSQKIARKTFEYMNIRMNHVECTTFKYDLFAYNNNPEELIPSTLDKIQELRSQDIPYFYTTSKTSPVIFTQTIKYLVPSTFRDAKKQFNKNYPIKQFAIDFKRNPDLAEFIMSASHTNGCIDFKPFKKINLKQIDQEKAYTQFYNCKYYTQFPSKITNFRQCTTLKGNGFYQIRNIDYSASPQLVQLNNILKIYAEDCVYTYPELLFLKDHHVKFDIYQAAYSSADYDFRFPDYMLEKENKISHYAKLCGQWNIMDNIQQLCLKGTLHEAENMQYYNKTNTTTIKYDENLQEISISYEKQESKTLCHYSAYITSYQRITNLIQLLHMDYSKLCRIIGDGIYFEEHEFEMIVPFRHKQDAKLNSEPGDAFINTYVPMQVAVSTILQDFGNYDIDDSNNANIMVDVQTPIMVTAAERENNQYEAHTGAGGCGKSHTVLTDHGFIDVIYITQSWMLSNDKAKEYNVKNTVTIRAIDENLHCLRKYQYDTSTIVIDEVSMENQHTINMIKKYFPYHQVLILGDIGYQLPPVKGEVVCLDGFYIINHTHDYRAKCEELKAVKQYLRDCIDKNINPDLFQFNIKTITQDKIQDVFTINDYILTSRNKCTKHHKISCNCDNKNIQMKYNDQIRPKFARTSKKYQIIKNSANHCNGEIVIADKKPANSIETYAYTIHAFQGKTIDDAIMYLDLNNFWEMQFLYTAVSRVRKLSQICIIIDN